MLGKIKMSKYLMDLLPNFIRSIKLSVKETLVIELFTVIDLPKLAIFLLKHTTLCFSCLTDYICVDFLPVQFDSRYSLYLVLLSIKLNLRILINYTVSTNQTYSLSSIYKSVNWLEREIWDLYGLSFIGNKDMRRILTDYGFSSFPLRKDFPVTGFVELRYNDMLKRIVSLNLSLVQEFRNFELLNPWVST